MPRAPSHRAEAAARPRAGAAGPAPRSNPSRAAWIAAALLAAFALLALRSAWVHSGVPDEVAVHVPAGFLYATTGRYTGGLGEDSPLVPLWIAAPSALAGSAYQPFDEQGLFGFRLPVIVLALAGAACTAMLARRLHGCAAALAALGAFAFSPTLIAHASLSTLDVPIAVAVVAAVLCAHRVSASGRFADFAWLGLAVGAACATKIQGLAMVPIVALQLALAPESFWRRRPPDPKRVAGGALLALTVAWLVLHLAYGVLPGITAGWLPESFVDATRKKLLHGSLGHFGYLRGEYSTQGWWSYFPIALAVKTPLPLLVAASIGAVATRSRTTAVWIGLPVLVFLAAAVMGRIDIGVRHVLPIFPFVFVAAGAGLVVVWTRARWAALLLAAVYAGEALWISPHHLLYFNELGGGPRGGYRVLLDSNYDWGQHDGALREYLAATAALDRSATPIAIDPDPLVPRGGRIFVGASALHGILGSGPQAYRWLRERAPDARIAYTWFEYRVPLEQAESLPIDRKSDPRRVALARHVLRAAEGPGVADSPPASLAAARACFALFEYDCAIGGVRAVLRMDPTRRGAFWIGSEITARKRLGVLHFSGREYLDGFAGLAPAESWLEPAALGRAAERYRAGDALRALHEAIGDLRLEERDFDASLEHFRLAHAVRPDGFGLSYKLAWLLAAAPDARLRDGEQALTLALVHGERTSWKTAAAYDVLAAAHAERGDFAEAVRAAQQALVRAGDGPAAERIRERLALYASGRPYRASARGLRAHREDSVRLPEGNRGPAPTGHSGPP